MKTLWSQDLKIEVIENDIIVTDMMSCPFNGIEVDPKNGAKAWYKDGKCHREDGPAVIHSDGKLEWHLHNEKFDVVTWNNITKFYDDDDLTLLKLEHE